VGYARYCAIVLVGEWLLLPLRHGAQIAIEGCSRWTFHFMGQQAELLVRAF
jgi:hypothetical protein